MLWRAILVSIAVTALASGGAAGASSPTEDLGAKQRSALLAEYTPILYFHPDEDWSPVPVERFLGRAKTERQAPAGVWNATPGIPTSSTGCTLKPCYRFNLPCSLRAGDRCYERLAPTLTDWKHGYVYGRVVDVPQGTPPPTGLAVAARYLVHYRLF